MAGSSTTQHPDRAAGPDAGALAARVNDALAVFERAATGRDLGAADAGDTGSLFRATREAVAALPATGARELAHRILEVAATRSVRMAFHASPFATEWTDLLLEAVQRSDYTVGDMFFSRARRRGDDTLFLVSTPHGPDRLTWNEARERVSRIGRALLALQERRGIDPVAMLSANSPELALFDLACLSLGVPNVPRPVVERVPGGQQLANFALELLEPSLQLRGLRLGQLAQVGIVGGPAQLPCLAKLAHKAEKLAAHLRHRIQSGVLTTQGAQPFRIGDDLRVR